MLQSEVLTLDPAARAAEVGVLWEEVRKALEVTRWTERERSAHSRLVRVRGALDPGNAGLAPGRGRLGGTDHRRSPPVPGAHCFTAAVDRPRPGLAGLRFTPALNAPSFAIEGALRLDRDARELRYLEVQYSRLHIRAPRVDRSRRVRAIDEIGRFVLDIREPWER